MNKKYSVLNDLIGVPITQSFCVDPLGDGKSQIKLIDSMGNDLSVVNDARVSYDKESKLLSDKDIKLINYLIKHNHSSPLRGVVFKFKVKAPLYLARQWFKHVIASNHNDSQLGWNEMSMRYVEMQEEADFYLPFRWRKQSKTNKQKGDEYFEDQDTRINADRNYLPACTTAFALYQELIQLGVCKEQARGILPMATYTSWIWTTSLQAVLHFLDLRKGEGAQWEIQQYATAIEELIKPIVPHTMEAWNLHKGN